MVNILLVLAIIPLLLLAMVFDFICAISILGWVIFLAAETTATKEVLEMLDRTLKS